jgi:hypothetical protein
MTRSLALLVCAVITAAALAPAPAGAQAFDDVQLLENFFIDATRNGSFYGEPQFLFADNDFGSLIAIGGRAGLPLGENFQLGGEFAFANVDPDQGDGESGLTDMRVAGRYNFATRGDLQVAAGGFITLPIGSEDIGEGNTDIGGFGAVRYPVSDGVVLVGSGGLYFVEAGDDRDVSLALGGGAIFETSRELHWLAELTIQTEGDIALLSGGADYRLAAGGHLRGQLGLGLGDGSPDLQLRVGYLLGL